MGLTRKLSEKTWWFIQENHISDDVLFLFLSLGSSWRQGFFVVCCQEQYQPSSRWSRLAPEQNYSHLPSPDDPWCLTPIFGSPQICILYSQRCESKGRKRSTYYFCGGKYSLSLLHDRVKVTHSGSHKLLQRQDAALMKGGFSLSPVNPPAQKEQGCLSCQGGRFFLL